ncbi:MAG TPA: hypothetical protein VMH02_09580 [Verrucomicrobiae bacterium]|nr:hypothetical protein [Verrucomicrobiae bacterium]
MFRPPLRARPLVSDIAEVRLRTPVRRADEALARDLDIHLPNLRIW